MRPRWVGRLGALGLLFLLAIACTAKPAGELFVPTPTGQVPAVDALMPTATQTSSPAETVPTTAPPDSNAEPVDPALSGAAAEDEPMQEYVVQDGDTLLGLANTWGVPMAAIQKANDMGAETVVKVGTTLVVPSPAGWEAASRFWVVYVVESGETMGQIAQKYGLDVASIVAVNELSDANAIAVGQELILPLDGPAVAAAAAPTPTPVPPTAIPREPTVTLDVPVVATVAEPGGEERPPPQPAAANVADVAPPRDVSGWAQEVVRLINEVRAQHGLPPYVYNDILAQAAQAHAEDCTQRGWCSHTGSDGASIKVRVQRAGYQGSGWAECWAQRQTPQGALDIWMAETPPNDPHRRMMLHTWFGEVGVGIAKAPYGYYFIADFGRP